MLHSFIVYLSPLVHYSIYIHSDDIFVTCTQTGLVSIAICTLSKLEAAVSEATPFHVDSSFSQGARILVVLVGVIISLG